MLKKKIGTEIDTMRISFDARLGRKSLNAYLVGGHRALGLVYIFFPHKCRKKIKVSPGPYPASNSPPDCCIWNFQVLVPSKKDLIAKAIRSFLAGAQGLEP